MVSRVTAGLLLKDSRRATGFTQTGLAASSQIHQSAISRIERQGGASFDTIERLLGALGLRLIAVPISRPTVADYASELRSHVADGRPVIRLLAETTNTLVQATPHERALLVASPPPPTANRGVDSFLAGLVEHVCGLEGPAWTSEPARFTETDWVLNPFPEDSVLDGIIRAATPPAFARHGVYVDASDLASV